MIFDFGLFITVIIIVIIFGIGAFAGYCTYNIDMNKDFDDDLQFPWEMIGPL